MIDILGRLDQLKLSNKFLESIQPPGKSGSLKDKIPEYFRPLFQYYMINGKYAIPWDKLTRTDFVNWPEDVPVKRPDNLASVQRKTLNNVLENIKLSDHFKNTYKVRLGYSRSEKLKLISRHLLNLIKKHIGISFLPFPKIYPKEIVNWPALYSVNPQRLLLSDLEYIFQNLNSIDLSKNCIERLKASFKPKLKYQRLSDQLRHHILNMLNEISDKRNNIRVKWSKIERDSFTWWPAGIQVIDPMRLSADDLRKILENKDKIKFTEEFKADYLKYLDST